MITDPTKLPLRDIHLPEPISWWPPALGWWVVMVGVIVLLLAAIIVNKKRRGQPARSIKSISHAQFRKLCDAYRQHEDAHRLIKELSMLLRRISISLYPRAAAAGLTGEAWLQFLDRIAGSDQFMQGPGRVLIEAPYRPLPEFDTEALLVLCSTWINKLPDNPSKAACP
jgi:hypothetical protein